MRVSCFEIDDEGRLSAVEFEGAVERWRAGSGPFWIDLESSEPTDHARILADVGFGEEIAGELLRSGHGVRVLTLDEALFFEFPTRVLGDPSELMSASFVCFDRLLVTLRDTRSEESTAFAGGLVKRLAVRERSSSALACAVLVELSLDLRSRTSALRERTVAFSRQMDADPDAIDLQQILDLRREIIDLDAVADERSAVMDMLESCEHTAFDLKGFSDQLRVARSNTAATSRRVDRLDRRAGDLRLRYDGQQQEKMNRRLSRLTIISAIFLPLTLIAGIYGMNFDDMPELHQPLGYPLTLGAMGLVAIGMIWWFRVRGWMD